MHHLKLPGLAGALTAGVTDGVKPARRLPARTQSQQAQGRPVCVCCFLSCTINIFPVCRLVPTKEGEKEQKSRRLDQWWQV